MRRQSLTAWPAAAARLVSARSIATRLVAAVSILLLVNGIALAQNPAVRLPDSGSNPPIAVPEPSAVPAQPPPGPPDPAAGHHLAPGQVAPAARAQSEPGIPGSEGVPGVPDTPGSKQPMIQHEPPSDGHWNWSANGYLIAALLVLGILALLLVYPQQRRMA